MKKKCAYILLAQIAFLFVVTITKAQNISKDKPYKFGDFLIQSPDSMNIDYILKSQPLTKKISKGDTLYEDSKCLILGNADVPMSYEGYGIFKKYISPYKFPQFEVPVYKGKLSGPNFKTDMGAWLYRTQIREQCQQKGINFAGHFTLAMWGCGSECDQIAIVDRINGNVYYSHIFNGADNPFYTLSCNKNSDLVIMNDFLIKDHKGYIFCSEIWEIIYMKWNKNKLELLSATKLNDHPAYP